MDKRARSRPRPATERSIRQTALDILAEAERSLAAPSKTNAVRIHDFRKAMKRLRAVLRLVPPAHAEEADAIRMQARDLARELGGPRDVQSALDAVRDLAKKRSKKPLAKRSAKAITERLAALRQSSEHAQLNPDTKRRLAAWVEATQARLRGWPADAPERDALADGLARHYKRARRRRPDTWSAATAEDIHEFRQRVIVHRYQLDVIEPLRPALVRKWINAAQRLRTRLGRYQDLTLLDRMSMPGGPLAPWRAALAPAVAERQQDHLEAAARGAARVFGAPAKSFRKAVAAL